MVGSVRLHDGLVTFQKRSVNLLPDIQGCKHELETHPPARDWTAAAVPWPYSPPGPSHTLPPHMTSPACWPLKQSNKDECWVFTKPGRGTRAACPSLSPQTFPFPHSCSPASEQDPYVGDCYCITSPSSSALWWFQRMVVLKTWITDDVGSQIWCYRRSCPDTVQQEACSPEWFSGL